MRPAGDRDHLGGEVDAERVHPERVEKSRDAAGTAPAHVPDKCLTDRQLTLQVPE